jgi:large subunit ribosomal protein L25
MSGARNDVVAVTSRTKTGTTASKALRHAGKIPATLSGHGETPLPIAIDAKRFDELLNSGARHHLLHVTIDGKTKDTAIVRDVERHPISRRVISADLQRVSAREEVEASLEIITTGTPAGAQIGGVIEIVTHQLAVKGPADSIPESLELDVSALNVHDNIHAGAVPLPKDFTLVTPADTVVVTLVAPRTISDAEVGAVSAEAPAATETASEGGAP